VDISDFDFEKLIDHIYLNEELKNGAISLTYIELMKHIQSVNKCYEFECAKIAECVSSLDDRIKISKMDDYIYAPYTPLFTNQNGQIISTM
jgi:hypothetical protein